MKYFAVQLKTNKTWATLYLPCGLKSGKENWQIKWCLHASVLSSLSLNGLITVGYLSLTAATQRQTQQQTENSLYSSIRKPQMCYYIYMSKCFLFCFTKLVKTPFLACSYKSLKTQFQITFGIYISFTHH